MMTETIIVVSPSFDRRGKRRHDRFDALLKDDAEVICGATRQPLLDSSRVLLARGLDPSTVLCMVHSHAPTVVTLRSPIGVAAQYDVMGSAFVRRKPITGPMPSSGIANGGSAGPRVPGSTEAAAGVPHKDPLCGHGRQHHRRHQQRPHWCRRQQLPVFTERKVEKPT